VLIGGCRMALALEPIRHCESAASCQTMGRRGASARESRRWAPSTAPADWRARREEVSNVDRRLAGCLATLFLLVSACTVPAATPPSSPAATRFLTQAPAATRAPITLAGEPMKPCIAGGT